MMRRLSYATRALPELFVRSASDTGRSVHTAIERFMQQKNIVITEIFIRDLISYNFVLLAKAE